MDRLSRISLFDHPSTRALLEQVFDTGSLCDSSDEPTPTPGYVRCEEPRVVDLHKVDTSEPPSLVGLQERKRCRPWEEH